MPRPQRLCEYISLFKTIQQLEFAYKDSANIMDASFYIFVSLSITSTSIPSPAVGRYAPSLPSRCVLVPEKEL